MMDVWDQEGERRMEVERKKGEDQNETPMSGRGIFVAWGNRLKNEIEIGRTKTGGWWWW